MQTEAAKGKAGERGKRGGVTVGAIVGQVELRSLDEVKPNPWNPNRMTDQLLRSLVHGLRTDGWLSSQALLVWGSDEKGAAKNLIIDGEHRYRAALDVGFEVAPMVRLDGLTEAQAKALTIKMNQKRGEFADDLLASLVRDIERTVQMDYSADFGFSPEDISRLGLGQEISMEFLDGLEEGASGEEGDSQGPKAKPEHVSMTFVLEPEQCELVKDTLRTVIKAGYASNVTEAMVHVVKSYELTEEEDASH